LKQLQLIQILGIKALRPVNTQLPMGKADCVNRMQCAERRKAASGDAGASFKIRKSRA
jgi:hypothetical protein